MWKSIAEYKHPSEYKGTGHIIFDAGVYDMIIDNEVVLCPQEWAHKQYEREHTFCALTIRKIPVFIKNAAKAKANIEGKTLQTAILELMVKYSVISSIS